MGSHFVELPSVAFFGAQNKAAEDGYLHGIYRFLCQSQEFLPFMQVLKDLPSLWSLLSTHDPDLAAVSHGPQSLQALSDWILTGSSNKISASARGIIAIPLLTTIQLVQYYQYLQAERITHAEFIKATRDGAGIQGFCSGLLSSAVVACSANEEELVNNACKALRLAVGVGAYGDLGIEDESAGTTMMVMRLNHEEQAEEILDSFPKVHISTFTDPKTVTVVGTPAAISEVDSLAGHQGLRTQPMLLRGRYHCPENHSIANKLIALCDQTDRMGLPERSSLQVNMRSNMNARIITKGSLTADVVKTILTSQCRWHDIMSSVATDLQDTGRASHSIVQFGIGDCVPINVFNKAGLEIKKLDALSFQNPSIPNTVEASPEYSYPENAIAVTGMACRTAGAQTVEEFWDLVSSGRSMCQEVPRERIDMHGISRIRHDKWAQRQKFYGNFVSDVDAFDNSFFHLSPREATAMDPQQRLLLEIAYEATESSGYLASHRRDAGDRVGVFVGASYIDYIEHGAAHEPIAYSAPGTIRAFLCGRISHYFGWTGPSEVFDTACSASEVAIARACRALQAGECSMALAGGVNLISTPTNFLDLGKAGFLSPSGQCKPFTGAADGYCRGEGVGLIVLKCLSQARLDGNRILGVIPGAATNQGGLSSSIMVPHGPSQIALFHEILRQASMRPEEVSYVEAHGPGTQAGDPVEIASIREVFGGPHRCDVLQVGSVKANIGHCEPAAGIISVIKTLLMIEKGILPPLANFSGLNPKIPPLEPDRMTISGAQTSWDTAFKAVCVNSYGAAGSNSALIVCQPPKGQGTDRQEGRDLSFPIVLSALSKQSLIGYFKILRKHLAASSSGFEVGDLAFSFAERTRRHRFLWTATVTKPGGLLDSMGTDGEDINEILQHPKRVVLVFPGQSRQSIGFDKALFDSCTILRTHLTHCDQEAKILGVSDLLSAIFAKQPLEDIILLQCGTFAVQYACASSWISCGLKVDALIGHSFGELTALAVSGTLDLRDALRIVASRARFMASKWGSERGTMLAIHEKAEVISDLITRLPQSCKDVEIACYNAHASHVVVGAEASITELERLLTTEQDAAIKYQRLDVSHGFHSCLTEGFLDDLDRVAYPINFGSSKIHLETCTPQQLDKISSTRISQHTREPVYFYQAVERIEEQLGPCIWLGADFNSPIISMVNKAVKSPKIHVFQALKYDEKADPLSSISKATETLWREGVSVSYWNFHKSQCHEFRHMWLPPYQLERKRFWLPYVDRAAEALQNQNSESSKDVERKSARVSKPLIFQDKDGQFKVNTASNHFSGIVSGHSVLQHPLCPASMYMECATMAAQTLNGSIQGKAIWFENLRFETPLGLDPTREVSLSLNPSERGNSWFFKFESRNRGDQKNKSIIYAKGMLGLENEASSQAGLQFESHQRLVTSRMIVISSSSETETFRTSRLYSLFSRVVNYGNTLKRISSISIAGPEAIAEVHTKGGQTNRKESTVTQMCDTVALDNFIQVAGLLMNSDDDLSLDAAFIATGINSVFISANCDFFKDGFWKVYTMITRLNTLKATADIFAMNRDGSILVVIVGANFSRLPLKQIGRSLEGISQISPRNNHAQKSRVESQPTSDSNESPPTMTPIDFTNTNGLKNHEASRDTEAHFSKASNRAWPQSREDMTSLMAEITGIEQSAMTDHATLQSLGFDSLSLTELKSEIEDRVSFQFELDAETTVAALHVLLEPTARLQEPKRPQNGDISESKCSGPKTRQNHILETLPYKTVDDLEVLADLYFPREYTPSKPMPIALMIHGGGFMTMSRTAIRPWQTSLLIEHNVLPISIDHRLCPEVNLVDGPMEDARDALTWVRNNLPAIASKHDISIDPGRIAVIGWSTGGHLAMSTAWTTTDAGLEPPKVVLNFYGPSNFESEVWLRPRAVGYPARTMSMQDIRRNMSPRPISNHNIPTTESQFAGLCVGDARSELVFDTMQSDNFVPILLRGVSAIEDNTDRIIPEEIQAISPLAQVRMGRYRTPTCIVHGDDDEVVPCGMSKEFGETLGSAGVPSEVIASPGAKHMHDLLLKPGKPGWEEIIVPAYNFLLHHL